MARIRGKTLIKRFSLPYTKRELTIKDDSDDNPWSNSTEAYVFTRGECQACTLQSVSAWSANSLPEGDRTKQMFTLFTNTQLYNSVEGSERLADAIYIPASMFGVDAPVGLEGWYRVVAPKYRMNGVVPHTEAIIVKDYYTLDASNLSQYPSTTLLAPLVDTKAKLQDSSGWLATWTGENT